MSLPKGKISGITESARAERRSLSTCSLCEYRQRNRPYRVHLPLHGIHRFCGLDSGLEYNINEVDKELHTYVGANTVASLVNAVAIGPPGEPQIKVKVFTHMTWTPNGDVTGIVDKITFVCE